MRARDMLQSDAYGRKVLPPRLIAEVVYLCLRRIELEQSMVDGFGECGSAEAWKRMCGSVDVTLQRRSDGGYLIGPFFVRVSSCHGGGGVFIEK